jgi:hypothetical protein
MAVYRLFKNRAFEPELIATMTTAYADICRALGLRDRDQLETNAVAKKIIELAECGRVIRFACENPSWGDRALTTACGRCLKNAFARP